jgi:hypothetical protein
MIQARTQRIIRTLKQNSTDPQNCGTAPSAEDLDVSQLERELAQLELFCLMNGLSLELFDQWKLSRTNRTSKDDPRTTD